MFKKLSKSIFMKLVLYKNLTHLKIYDKKISLLTFEEELDIITKTWYIKYTIGHAPNQL